MYIKRLFYIRWILAFGLNNGVFRSFMWCSALWDRLCNVLYGFCICFVTPFFTSPYGYVVSGIYKNRWNISININANNLWHFYLKCYDSFNSIVMDISCISRCYINFNTNRNYSIYLLFTADDSLKSPEVFRVLQTLIIKMKTLTARFVHII